MPLSCPQRYRDASLPEVSLFAQNSLFSSWTTEGLDSFTKTHKTSDACPFSHPLLLSGSLCYAGDRSFDELSASAASAGSVSRALGSGFLATQHL